MKKTGTRRILVFFLALFTGLCSIFALQSPQRVQAASGGAKLHFLTLPENTNAILVENNGKFGMVDSGEDTDYPNGSDPNYPVHPGISTGFGFENDVISYLRSLGVNKDNFEFYIGTHPHSDHIGSADEVIRAFHPKRVYIQEYSDAYISDPARYYDNQYVYDRMVAAAKEVNATLIQNFSTDAPLYPETISISGSIFWKDSDNTAAKRLNSVSLELSDADGNKIAAASASSDSNWKYTFHGIPKYNDNKQAISYTITPQELGNAYTVSGNGYDFTFTYIPKPQVSESTKILEKTASPLSIIWDDKNNTDGKRPTSVVIQLQRSVVSDTEEIWEDIPDGKLTLSEADNWMVDLSTFLPNAEENTLLRINVLSQTEGYTFSVDHESYTITADYTPSVTESSQETLPADPSEYITDDDSSSLDLQPSSDDMHTESIPSSDQVDPTHPDDPTNLETYERKAVLQSHAAKTVQNSATISTPVFTLGDTMTIEIMHYGTEYQTTSVPDANYFSLGVKVSANGKTAFLAGDINNYDGTETALAQRLGHVNLLCLGHHGYYGSNTSGYINTLSPDMAILPGNFIPVSNEGSPSTLDILLNLGRKGTPVYATALYQPYVSAIVVNLNENLSTNIPKNTGYVAWAAFANTPLYYKNGIPQPYNGWMHGYNQTFYFDNSITASKSTWISEGGKWFYVDASGFLLKDKWFQDNGFWYYATQDGSMATGWIQKDGHWYYLDSTGKMLTGKQTLDGSVYYFSESGQMAVSSWVGNDYYGADGKLIPNYQNHRWKKDQNGWWYQRDDGSYPANAWEFIDGSWYYFDGRGYRVSGWLLLGNTYYYMNTDGKMQTGWVQDGGVYYYMNPSGAMCTGWQLIGNNWYYFSGNGSMAAGGWHWIGGKCYYMHPSGIMASNTWIDNSYVDASGAWVPGYSAPQWIKSGSRWWYRHSDGSYTKNNWELINGQWYYFDGSGWMMTGWLKLNNIWYYLSGSGAMLGQGWHQIGGNWYYMYASGAMAANTWIGEYYVNASGAWVTGSSSIGQSQTAQWIKSGNRWWYRHSDGGYTKNNWELINGQWYYFDASGWMMTGWIKLNGTWYYLSDSGAMLTQGWHWIGGKCYYMYASGAMAANTRVEGYYVDASGAWIP